MNDLISKYLDTISKKFSYSETTEMGYRADFETLLKSVFATIGVTRIDHDPKANQGNRPDFIILKNDIPLLYIEAKDIGISLDKIEKSEQMARYFGYANLILTDYLEFRFYRNGLPYGDPIKLAEYNIKNRTITTLADVSDSLVQTLIDFAQTHKEPIKSGTHLAKIMGGKAQRIRDTVIHLFESKAENAGDLKKLYESIRTLLVHDLTPHTFADMYAQTLVYGLFVARYNDKSPENFTRSEARELIPNSNRFLKNFFDHIVGIEFKSSLKYIVDELCEVFSHSDVEKLLSDFYRTSKGAEDPVIHFYEDFLNEYDPVLRKKMGAYYTPQPVVDFIVNSVDQLLKDDFGLSGGLADTSKTKENVHRVQVLDPATGTGTFMSAVVDKIYEYEISHGQKGKWFGYIHHDLLPRLHAFEIMMAPYVIAHLRMGIKFRNMGFWDFHRRLGIYLTNTLEESDLNELPLAFGLAESIAEESKEASVIKNKSPIMVVIGNPPYSGVSSNETKYANNLVERYKVEAGGKQKLQERKHWLNDDYVKFIAFAESLISKNQEGVMAMITNNGYLDNPTFRGMRWHLANTFDKIYLLDLHGNAKKHEKTPVGGKDENVFNIMQGVGIILAIKTGKKPNDTLADVFHAELFGTRKYKFDALKDVPNWKRILLDEKYMYFVPKNLAGMSEYEKGFSLDELFTKVVTGIVTMGDNFILAKDRSVVSERVQKLANGEYTEEMLNREFGLGKNYAKFVIKNHKDLIFDETKLVQIEYRPFDTRWTYFDNKVLWRWREDIMNNYIARENIGLLTTKAQKDSGFSHVFIAHTISEAIFLSPRTGSNAMNFPLYIYDFEGNKHPNFNQAILLKVSSIIGHVQAEALFDYIYAILHSPAYRRKYAEFLKTAFPRIPYPKNKEHFDALSSLGKDLRELHLLKSPLIVNASLPFPEYGNDTIENITYKDSKVYINSTQYFGDVPKVAWEFYIGGYQPAQKWLKDRKGNVLTSEDIDHYEKIITVLIETDKIMKKLDDLM